MSLVQPSEHEVLVFLVQIVLLLLGGLLLALVKIPSSQEAH